jgi:hypothetical protein
MKTLDQYTAKKTQIPKPDSISWYQLGNLTSDLEEAFSDMNYNADYELGAGETEATKEGYESAYIRAMFYLTVILERLDGVK